MREIHEKAAELEGQLIDAIYHLKCNDDQQFALAHQRLSHSTRELLTKHNDIADVVILMAVESVVCIADLDGKKFMHRFLGNIAQSSSIGEKKADLFLMPVIINTNNNGEQIYLSKNQTSRLLGLFREFNIIGLDDYVVLDSNIVTKTEISHRFGAISKQLNAYLELISKQDTELGMDDMCYMSPVKGVFNDPDGESFDYDSHLYFIRGLIVSQDGLKSKTLDAELFAGLPFGLREILNSDQELLSVRSVDRVLLPFEYTDGYDCGGLLILDSKLIIFLSLLKDKMLKLDYKHKDPIASVEVFTTAGQCQEVASEPDCFNIIIAATVGDNETVLGWRIGNREHEPKLHNNPALRSANKLIISRLRELKDTVDIELQMQNSLKITLGTDDLSSLYLLND